MDLEDDLARSLGPDSAVDLGVAPGWWPRGAPARPCVLDVLVEPAQLLVGELLVGFHGRVPVRLVGEHDERRAVPPLPRIAS